MILGGLFPNVGYVPQDPIEHIYTTEGTGLETIPNGVQTMTIEIWGGGGAGGNATDVYPGQGGGSGGYSKTVLSLSAGDWGASINYRVAYRGYGAESPGGPYSPTYPGDYSEITSGTYSITTMTANGGDEGYSYLDNTGGTGAGGTASGGNTTNTTGNNGAFGVSNYGGVGGAAIVGDTISGGKGGNGGDAPWYPGHEGWPGKVRFYYTYT